MADDLLDGIKAHLQTLSTGMTVSTDYFPSVPADDAIWCNVFVGAERETEVGNDRGDTGRERDVTIVIGQNLGRPSQDLSAMAAMEAAYSAAQSLAFDVFHSFRRLAIGDYVCIRRDFPTPGDFTQRDQGIYRGEMTITFYANIDDDQEED